jgi:hypothetical protein
MIDMSPCYVVFNLSFDLRCYLHVLDGGVAPGFGSQTTGQGTSSIGSGSMSHELIPLHSTDIDMLD